MDAGTRREAALAAITDPVIAALLAHIGAQDRYIDAAEAAALDVLRLASMPTPAPEWPRYGRGAA